MGPRRGKVPRALGVYWAKLAPTYQRRLGFIKNFRFVETSGDLPTAWRPIDQNCTDLSKGDRIYQKRKVFCVAKVMRTFRSAGPIVANEKKTGTLTKKTRKEGRTEKKRDRK